MPSLYYHVESTGVNILNTVTQQAVTGFLQELDLTKRFENAVYILQSFTSYSQYDDGNGAPSLIKNRCDVNVNYILDKSQVPWPDDSNYTTPAGGIRSNQKGMHSPIFIDKDAGVLIEHYTVACGIEMDFTLTFQTFEDACQAFDTLQTKYKGSLVPKPFDLVFSYPVSMGMYKYLVSAFKAKQDYQNKTFLEYINDNKVTEISFDVRKSQMTEPDADMELMVRCQQLNCISQLTMDQKEPEVIRENQLPDGFTISFNLILQFGRPNLVAIHTPVSIDNTVLDASLFSSVTRLDHFNPSVGGVYQELLVSEYMRRSYGDVTNRSGVVRIPIYDDWLQVDKTYLSYKYRPFIIAHFTLDGPVTTIDFNDLGDITLHPVVKAILRETKDRVLQYGGLFHISVYAGDLRLDPELLSFDENLVLTITSSRPDQVYHFVISETTNLQKTDPDWDPLLIKYRYFFPMTIERNLQSLIEKKFFYIAYDESLLTLINKLAAKSQLKPILQKMRDDDEVSAEIYSYTQNASQLADYMAYTQSLREDYVLPDEDSTDPLDQAVLSLYENFASPESRSLLVAFLEDALQLGYITIQDVPTQYLRPSQSYYPYSNYSGGTYGFNTPLRVLKYNFGT